LAGDSGSAKFQVGNIGAGAQVAIGENIRIEAAPKLRALHQLRADISDFTDRELLLADLREAATPAAQATGARVLALAGPPGVGKSAVAVHLSHLLIAEFPDVQLYVNLRTPSGEALAAEDVLASFLRALGVSEESIPQDAEERAALYRSQLADKRALVLLDNARGEAQVRLLLPAGPSCLAVVTSRGMLAALEEANHFAEVEVLQPPAAVELLDKIAGAGRVEGESVAAGELARLCGYLPLALRIAGARLRLRGNWSLARLVELLWEERRRLAELKVRDLDVRAAFELSHRELSEEQARLFGRLSLLGGPDFGVPVAAALMGSSVEATEELLGQLQEAQLLEPSGKDRYRFHDLLRLFAVECLEKAETPEARHEALERSLGWYVEQASAADATLDPTAGLGDRVKDALDWFEAERLALVAAVGRGHEAKLWKAVLTLGSDLVRFFELRSHWAEWERVSNLALHAARELGDLDGEGATLNNLGMVYDNQARWNDAVACYEQDLAICLELGDRHGEAQTLNNLGIVYVTQGRWDDAIACYQHSLAIKRELGDRHGEGMTLNNLGIVYRKHGQLDDAIADFEQSLAICRELGNRHGEGMTLNNLGLVYDNQGQWNNAITCYEHDLVICRELGDRCGEGVALHNLGVVYGKQGEWKDAIVCYEQDLAICRELGDRHGEGETLKELGIVFEARGDRASAHQQWRQALAILEALDAPAAAEVQRLLDR
jgi:tetratricopeptide (TPR) repeat protein